MTYLKTALASAAALALAAPALAGEGPVKTSGDYNAKMKVETETTAVMETEQNTAVMGAVETIPAEKINDTVGEILQADGEPSIQDDMEVVMADGHTVHKQTLLNAGDGMAVDNAIAVPGSNGTVTTVMCPAGTTAQLDMTCLITGDFEAELIDEDREMKADLED
ncbi:MAG: hypothetical protein WBF53_06610 [Litorimonas sp.]